MARYMVEAEGTLGGGEGILFSFVGWSMLR